MSSSPKRAPFLKYPSFPIISSSKRLFYYPYYLLHETVVGLCPLLMLLLRSGGGLFKNRGIYEEVVLYGGGFSTSKAFQRTIHPKIRALLPRRALAKNMSSLEEPPTWMSSPQISTFLKYYFPFISSSNKFF